MKKRINGILEDFTYLDWEQSYTLADSLRYVSVHSSANAGVPGDELAAKVSILCDRWRGREYRLRGWESRAMNQQWDWKKNEFINWSPSEQHKTAIKAAIEGNEDLFGWLEEMVGDGYKLSAVFDEKNATYIATMTCKNPSSPNFHYSLSVRHRDLWTAIQALAWGTYKAGRTGWKGYLVTSDINW